MSSFSTIADYRRTFCGLSDIMAFRRATHATDGEPIAIHIKSLGGRAVTCRPGTTDAAVLWDTFVRQYHLPPPVANPLPATILDLGANVGFTAAHLACLYPEARVFAVEMDSTNAGCARELLRAIAPDRTTVVEAAVWHEDTTVGIEGTESWGLRVGDAGEGGDVRALTPLSLLRGLALEAVDFVKMDIEGAEGPLLERCPEFLDRIQSLNLEYHPPLERAWIEEVLRSRGFRVATHPNHRHAVLAWRD